MCDKCSWTEYLKKIEDTLDDSDFAFAENTLNGIYEWVEQNAHITSKQKRSIDNIIDSQVMR
jgi:hypothetical protein